MRVLLITDTGDFVPLSISGPEAISDVLGGEIDRIDTMIGGGGWIVRGGGERNLEAGRVAGTLVTGNMVLVAAHGGDLSDQDVATVREWGRGPWVLDRI